MTRSRIAKVRVSDEELQALLNFAEKQGVNISKAIRMMITMIPQIDARQLRLLRDVKTTKQALDRHTKGK